MNIWHVYTICPCGWSAADGEGMEVLAEAEVAAGVADGKLKLVVATGWVGCGVTFEGVEA